MKTATRQLHMNTTLWNLRRQEEGPAGRLYTDDMNSMNEMINDVSPEQMWSSGPKPTDQNG